MPPHPAPVGAARRPRPRAVLLLLATLLASLLVVMIGASPAALALPPPGWEPPEDPEPPVDPEPEPDPDPIPHPLPTPIPNLECDDPAGFARPNGIVPPGYVYSPTKFDGTVTDPQVDDTFVADAPGHAPHTGKLRTRTAHGREEMLVCAHVGTNTPTDALTPFATGGANAHAATIRPFVVIIDATGASTSYRMGKPGIDATLTHYKGSTARTEGIMQMWVPFTPNLREPGFTVRTEIRGTAALPNGTTQVMGADEVFVHVGASPLHQSTRVEQAVGVALDDSVVAERPSDPGKDDLSSLVAPLVEPEIKAAIAAKAPSSVDGEFSWEGGPVPLTKGSAEIHSLDPYVHSFRFDLEDFNGTEGRVRFDFEGSLRPKLTIHPRSVGLVSVVSGSCEAEAFLDFAATGTFIVNLSADGTRPEVEIALLEATFDLNFFDLSGDLWVLYGPIPAPTNCNALEDRIQGRFMEKVGEALQGMRTDPAVEAELEASVRSALDPVDLASAPFSLVNVDGLANGTGFTLDSPRFVETAPPGHVGGDVLVNTSGIDVAAGFRLDDQGGTRFPFSYVPTQTTPVATQTWGRQRPDGSEFDLGLILSGSAINQLSRSVTAGKTVPITTTPGGASTSALVGPSVGDFQMGLLDMTTNVGPVNVAIHPAVPPLYVPNPQQGWPADGAIDLYVPSLRVSTSLPEIATMAADVRMGVNATIDGSNHLVPTVQSSNVKARFLRLDRSINQATETTGMVAGGTALVQDRIPTTVADMLTPITLPDLSNGKGDFVHFTNLTVGSLPSGHLGVYADVATGTAPAPPPLFVTAFAGGTATTAPTSFAALIDPAQLQGTAPITVNWTFKDARSGAVLYQSPAAGEGVYKSIPTAALQIADDPCSGDRSVVVEVTATARRGSASARTDIRGASISWAGPVPQHPPAECFPPPEEEPQDPGDPEDPPICMTQPWKCPA